MVWGFIAQTTTGDPYEKSRFFVVDPGPVFVGMRDLLLFGTRKTIGRAGNKIYRRL